jgi:signal transduction histidine kinase
MVAALNAGGRMNNAAYDWMLTRQPAENWTPQSVVAAIDERTLSARGGMRRLRLILAEALDQIAAAQPKAVALDVILHDAGDETEDKRLAASLRATPNLILPSDRIVVNGQEIWENPLPLFRESAAAVGHVHRGDSREDRGEDGVTRSLHLEDTAGGERRWALFLEAFRLTRGKPIIESPDDVDVAGVVIPSPRNSGRLMRIRYLQSGIPTVSVLDLKEQAEKLRGKTVFLGVTANGGPRDRPVSPYGEIPGVAMHGHAYETLARGQFLTSARDQWVFGICVLIAAAAGFIFTLRSVWQAYGLAVLLLMAAAWIPLEFFRHDVVFPFAAPVAVAWSCCAGAAIFQHFFVRRQLRRSESEKSRYQQAIHWAAHEMRTPLTAIQGSSEIMTRYSLPEQKSRELSEMINSESKRLARLIQTFLDVERLADGQMQLKREPFPAADLVETCIGRIRHIAARKNISVSLDTSVQGMLVGDRELMEYALYNLLTNAVKYSPADTEVRIAAETRGRDLHLAVRDQGMGMDSKELKSIFKKFYRTKRAEASGEAGTGIGLSIVEQIVTHHGGRMQVASEPGKGSCFTMIFTAPIYSVSGATVSKNAETLDRRG